MTRIYAILAILIVTSWAQAESLQDVRKHLVFDSRVLESVDNAKLIMGKPSKHADNPLMQADQPWENSLNNLYANVIYDPDARQFKMWYGCVLADKEAIAKMDPPRTVHDVGWYELYATSVDGVKWNRPRLDVHAFAGSKDNNAVVRDTPNVGVFRDTNPKCPPDRRYKMIYDVGLGKMRVRFSPDGVHWSDPIEPKGFGARTGDTHNNAFWDARLGKYVAITRFVLGERLVARAESDDFLSWDKERLALRSTIEEGRDRQTYCMPAFAYGNAYLGLVMMYNVAADKTVDCELAWSPDTVNWHRVLPGTPFLPRGERKSYDSKCIYAQANPPILKDGLLHLYYGGSDFPHIGWKRHCLPCLATLRLDGFAGYRSEVDKIAVLRSRPLRWTKDGLRVSADVATGGSIRVVVEDAAGEVARSKPIVSDVSDAVVVWDNKDLPPMATAVRLRFELDQATLFAFRGPELVDATEPRDTKPAARTTWDEKYPGKPKPVVAAVAGFDAGDEGWSAIDTLAHFKTGGLTGGFLRGSRKEAQPYLLVGSKGSQGTFVGNWPMRFGGTGVKISFAARMPQAGPGSRVEIFAKEIAQWSFDRLKGAGPEWQTLSTTIRFDWTDVEAEAAGWRKALHGFTWRDTMRNVGKVVFAATVLPGANSEFDLDDVRIETNYQ